MNWAGQTAIVTGGAVRLGREIALALADEGLNVVVHYGGSESAARETVEQIRAKGVRAVAVQADFHEPTAAARRLFEQTTKEFDGVSVLVNSAAIFEPGPLTQTTDEQWDRHFSINLKAPAFLSREFAKYVGNDRPGHIVNITDWRATRPRPGHLAYTLTKSGLITLTHILAQELAPAIQVNALALGAILPPPGADADHMQRLAEAIPLRQTGSTSDVTEAVRFLLRSDFITGEILHVTGGEQLQSRQRRNVSDRILIKDLLLRAIIGVNGDERVNRQDVVINLVLETDTRAAGCSDDIADTVNYRTITKQVIELVESSRYYLVEKMAEEIADLCLTDARVHSVQVTVEKPMALRFAKSVGVSIERSRQDE